MKESNEIKETLEGSIDRIDKKRRSFAKTGIAVPVIMTLASRPVFGAQCLSEMMSGNLSDPNDGDHCWGGMSPGFWKTPSGAPDYTTEDGQDWEFAWSKTGYSYYDALKLGENGNQWSDYMGGSEFNTTNFFFANHDPRIFEKNLGGIYLHDNDSDGKISVREALNAVPNNAGILHLIAGWLNIKYFSAMGEQYFLT